MSRGAVYIKVEKEEKQDVIDILIRDGLFEHFTEENNINDDEYFRLCALSLELDDATIYKIHNFIHNNSSEEDTLLRGMLVVDGNNRVEHYGDTSELGMCEIVVVEIEW